MDKRTHDPLKITAEDINPRYNWGRHLPVLGTMGVDFEERVDYRRMHRYRLARAQAALEASDLGALLLFDDNNIRYVTSTKIGEWARDKLSRWALLTRGGDPILWDFGSAAVHHKLYSPWLKPENCKAGLVGLRGLTFRVGERAEIVLELFAHRCEYRCEACLLEDHREARANLNLARDVVLVRAHVDRRHQLLDDRAGLLEALLPDAVADRAAVL